MLGKVFKYEMRALSRFLLPFYGFALVGAGLLRAMILLAPHIWTPVANFVTGISYTVSALMIVALVVLIIVVILARFYQSMLTSEGYLNFTLPATVNEHLLGRLFSGTLFGLLGLVVTFFAIRILTWSPGYSLFTFLPTKDIARFQSEYGAWYGIYLSVLAGIVILSVVGLISSLTKVYASMALGSQMGKSKILGSILFYFLLNMAEGFIAMPLIMLGMVKIFGDSLNPAKHWGMVFYSQAESVAFGLKIFWMVVGVISVVFLLTGVIYYFISQRIFSKRLNLE